MTLFIWRILCLVSMALFVAGVILLLCLRLLKNKYYHQFAEDEFIKKVKTANSTNNIYLTSGETKAFIKKYVVCSTAYDKYLVCNFVKKFEEIKYFVIQYSRFKRPISVLNITQRGTDESSKIISLKKRCKYVNVVIGSADGVVVNSDVIRPLSMSGVRIYAALKSFLIFLALFVIRHCAVELFGGAYVRLYLAHFYNYIALGASFAFALLSYLITVLCFRRKNVKARNGGALEYEFV